MGSSEDSFGEPCGQWVRRQRGRRSGCPLTYLFYFTVGSLRAETLPVRLL